LAISNQTSSNTSEKSIYIFKVIALQNADGSYDWNGKIFENKAAFEKALRECVYVGKILIIED
jgi:hypothetical protein